MDSFSLEEIAKELNMSKTNLKRALRIERNLTDSMKELLDTGEIGRYYFQKDQNELSEKSVDMLKWRNH